MTRPVRQKKHDRLMWRTQEEAVLACDMASAPFDHMARQMELKWGVDRLPELVSPETAAKWGATIAKLNAAIDKGDRAETVARVDVALRGFAALDAEATARGHQPVTPEVWEVELEGRVIGIIRDAEQWPAAQAARPGVTIYTLREVANALNAYKGLVLAEAVKAAIPGSEITRITNKHLEDDLPW